MITYAEASQIARDVGLKVDPKDSVLKYNKEKLELRERIEKRFRDFLKDHPDGVMTTPE